MCHLELAHSPDSGQQYLAWRLVLWGASPLYENEGLKEGSIPPVTPIDKVLGEGNCGEVTDRGKEACECVRQADNQFVVGRIHAKAARLRTETRYKAGGDR